MKYLTLISQKKIRLHGSLKFFDTFDGMHEAPTGIHSPDTTLFFMVEEDLCEVRRAATIGKVLDQRAVKICAQ
jgi:hypothetical protein